MAEGDNNINSGQNGGQPPSNGSNSNQNNVNGNTNPASNPPNPARPTVGTGDNITVSIEYMYGTPSDSATNNGATTTGASVSTNADGTTTDSPTAGPAQLPGGRPFPPGVVFLQFRDIPAGSSQERLQSIMSIASELAVRRMVDISALRFNKGISKEDFEALPVIPIRNLDTTVKDEGCSICYEPFVDTEPHSKKRSREEDDEEKKMRDDSIKRPTPESGVNATPSIGSVDTVSTPSSTTITATDETLPATPSTHEASFTPTETSTNANATNNSNLANDEETNPTYDHSAVEVPCKHVFGRECLYKWCKLEHTCPLCRHVIAESANTPIHVDPQQAASTTNAAFQRIHDLLYNSSNTTINGEANPLAGAAADVLRGMDNNNSTANTNNDTSNNTTNASSTASGPNGAAGSSGVPTANGATGTTGTDGIASSMRPSNIIFITPRWYTPPNVEATNTGDTSTGSEGVTINSSSTSENGSTTTAALNNERSPYERFRDVIGSYFDNLAHRTNESNNTNNDNNGTGTPTPAAETNSSSAPNTDSSASATSNSTRNLDLLAMGNSIRNSLLQHRNATANADGGAPTLFNSGVASYRNPSGNVSTYHLGAHEVFHASGNGNGSNNTSSDSATATTNSNDNNTQTTDNEESNSNMTTDETNNEQREDSNNDSNTHLS